MSVDFLNATPSVKVDGRELDESLAFSIERVDVEMHHSLPDSCTISFNDRTLSVFDDPALRVGARLVVEVSGTGPAVKELFNGEITGVEGRYDDTGAHAVLRGYDKAHRLHRNRKSETYENRTDSQIAQSIAAEHGLGTRFVESTSTRHTVVQRFNLTDWEFLHYRASELGFDVAVRDGELVFRPGDSPSQGSSPRDVREGGSGVDLVWGDNLQSFRPRVTAAEQAAEVEVRGWDPQTKQAVAGTASPQTTSADIQDTPRSLANTFGSARHVQSDRAITTRAEADVIATALAEHISSAFVEAEGVALGNPELRDGAVITVGAVGDRFNGRYVVSTARHLFDRGGYNTHFTVSGRHDRSLLALASRGGGARTDGGVGPRVPGVVVAKVTDIKDPDGRGRVRVVYPWLDEDKNSPWARVAHVGAGDQRGWYVLPEVGDEVLVAFAHGDVREPYVVGGLYNGRDTPRAGDQAVDANRGEVNLRSFTSRAGHFLEFDDTSNAERISIVDKSGNNQIVIDTSDNSITIECDGDMNLTSGGTITLEAQRDVKIKAGGSASTEAQQSFELKGMNITVEATGGALTAKGVNTEVNGSAGTTVKSGGVTQVQGSMVKIN